MVIHLEYCIAVYLLGSPGLSMSFWEHWMLTKVLAEEAGDRESMGKGTEGIVRVLLHLLSTFFSSRWSELFRDVPFQLQLRNEIRIALIVVVAGLAARISDLSIIDLGIGIGIGCWLVLL